MDRRTEDCLRTLPRTLKLGAYDWSVVFETGESENHAQADFQAHAIRVWPADLTSPNHAAGIVLHECLHVIFDNQGLENLKRAKDAREEQIIIGFEAGLVSLFRDNPKFLTWMKKWMR